MMAYFELVLLILVVASGVVALVDKIFFEKARWQQAAKDPEFAHLSKAKRKELVKAPLVADYARSLFLVLFIVLLFRSFVLEPFRIPSGSMLPTLKVGDFITVNKHSYGLRMPVWHTAITHAYTPKRGDVIVFHSTVNPKLDLIKRVIGLPGDVISYQNRKLTINGTAAKTKYLGEQLVPSDSLVQPVRKYQENLMGSVHNIYTMPWVSSHDFKGLVVPQGKLFVMGDNRDNSDDSRYWGFVPLDHVVGKATHTWLSWDSRNGSVRWDRFGQTIS